MHQHLARDRIIGQTRQPLARGLLHRVPLLQLDAGPLLVAECERRGRHGRDQPRRATSSSSRPALELQVRLAPARGRGSADPAASMRALAARRAAAAARVRPVRSRPATMPSPARARQVRLHAHGPGAREGWVLRADLRSSTARCSSRAQSSQRRAPGEVIRLDALQRHERHRRRSAAPR